MAKKRKNRPNHPSWTPRNRDSGGQGTPTHPSAGGGDHLAFAETASDRPILGSEIATREVVASFSSLTTLPNPDPILRSEGKSISVYRSFVDGHLSSILGKRKAAVRSRPWAIEQGKADKAATETLREIFDGLKVRDIMGETLDAPGFGVVYQETVWDRRPDNWIAPIRIEAKPQEWFAFAPDRSLKLVVAGGRLIEIPPRKVLVTRHEGSYLNPYGTPILSKCFWPLAFKRGGLKFWMLFVEKFGIPRTIGTVPAATPEADRAKLLSALASMVRDAVAVIPNNAAVTLLETKTGANTPFEALIHWSDSEMSKAVLGETLSTEVGSVGVRGAAEVHNQVRGDLAMDDASLVEQTMNQLIAWIWELNRPGDTNLPWFSIQMPEDLQMGRIERDKGLKVLGARFTPAYFLETYNIAPQHLAGIEDIRSRASGPSSFAEGGCRCGSSHGHQFADSAPEDLAALLRHFTPAELQAQVSELVAPIIGLAERGSSFAEFEQALDELFPHLTTRQMEVSLEKCMLLAEMKGRMDAKAP